MKTVTKEEDLSYIKQVREISLMNVCKDLKIDYFNVIKGKASAEIIHKARVELERRIKILKGE